MNQAILCLVVLWLSGPMSPAACGASSQPPGADGDIDSDADPDGDTEADADGDAEADSDVDGDVDGDAVDWRAEWQRRFVDNDNELIEDAEGIRCVPGHPSEDDWYGCVRNGDYCFGPSARLRERDDGGFVLQIAPRSAAMRRSSRSTTRATAGSSAGRIGVRSRSCLARNPGSRRAPSRSRRSTIHPADASP